MTTDARHTLRARIYSPAGQYLVSANSLDASDVTLADGPGSWTVTFPAVYDAAQAAVEGNRVLLERDGQELTSGPIEEITETVDEQHPYPGSVTLAGPDDWHEPADRLIYPDPAAAFTDQTGGAHDSITAALEDVLLHYLAANTGRAAGQADRRTLLTVPASAHRGPSVTASERFSSLLEAVQRLSALYLLPDGQTPVLGLRFLQGRADSGPVLTVYAREDRSASVQLAAGSHSLTGYTERVTMPASTFVGVGGAAPTAGSRFMESATDETSAALWSRRRETFLDRSDTTDGTVLGQAALAQLNQDRASVSVTVTPRATADQQVLRDYGIGDLILVRTRRNPAGYRLPVAVVRLTTSGGVETQEITVGAARVPTRVRLLQRLNTRTAVLERTT